MPRTSIVQLAEAATHALVEQLGEPPTTMSSLAALADQLARSLGFLESSCWRISQHGQASRPSLVYGRDDPEGMERYLNEGLMQADPVMQLAFRTSLPFTWGEAERLKQDDLTRRLFCERRARLSQDAVICPVFGPLGERACVTFLSGETLRPSHPERLYLSCIAHTLMTMVWDILGENAVPKDLNPILSRRESECVFWISEGKSASDIASILGISPHTVRDYLDSAMVKLDSRSRDELVLRAQPLGLLISFR